VLLSEAGSGKTVEMRKEANRLVSEGKFAVFVALESLAREPLTALLSADDEKSFDAWKADGQALGWFFLDAVDELKLTGGKLDRALLRLSKDIDGHFGRAHVIISCRPNDWRPELDMATVESRLPVPKRQPNPPPSPDETFSRALRRDLGETAGEPPAEKSSPAGSGAVRTVVLLPLSSRQVELFARHSGVSNAPAFLAEINRQNAWAFARRPLDLSELIATWTSSGRLGTRAEQHEANLTAKLKDDPDRPDRGVLSDGRARLGAERLALALALARTRTIRSPEQTLDTERAEGVLDPMAILRDWTEEERQALLRRALFDPATYGRIRFHHRSVQEFLAAQHLKRLRAKGMSTKAVFRLLFGERYGEEIVIPSMRTIAAWLALWDDAVRRELLKRAPEVLLSLGDPESLSLNARADIVRAFAAAYSNGGWRGLNIPIDEVRRLAHPELAPTIREIWGSGPRNTDVRELLLEMIWQGRIAACADLAQAAALDATSNDYHRIAAVRALIACDRHEIARQIAESIIADQATWPDKVVHGLAADLFPKIISVDELATLMRRTPEPTGITSGFGWVTRDIAQAVDLESALPVILRDKLSSLIWCGREAKLDIHRLQSKFGHLAPALAILCWRQIDSAPRDIDNRLIRACVIASRFGSQTTTSEEEIQKLRARLREDPALREQVFWVELAFVDEIAVAQGIGHRLYYVENDALIGHLIESDRRWLEKALATDSDLRQRELTLYTLLDLWQRRGGTASEVCVPRTAVKGDSTLETMIDGFTAPRVKNAEIEKMERESEQHRRAEADREAQRLRGWMDWKQALIDDSSSAFSSDNVQTTISNFYSLLSALSSRSHNHYNVWNSGSLIHIFGKEVAQRAAAAFKALWRTNSPLLWSA
jgi:hypothetical protein